MAEHTHSFLLFDKSLTGNGTRSVLGNCVCAPASVNCILFISKQRKKNQNNNKNNDNIMTKIREEK